MYSFFSVIFLKWFLICSFCSVIFIFFFRMSFDFFLSVVIFISSRNNKWNSNLQKLVCCKCYSRVHVWLYHNTLQHTKWNDRTLQGYSGKWKRIYWLCFQYYYHWYVHCIMCSSLNNNNIRWFYFNIWWNILISLSLSQRSPLICGVYLLRLWPFFYSISFYHFWSRSPRIP